MEEKAEEKNTSNITKKWNGKYQKWDLILGESSLCSKAEFNSLKFIVQKKFPTR